MSNMVSSLDVFVFLSKKFSYFPTFKKERGRAFGNRVYRTLCISDVPALPHKWASFTPHFISNINTYDAVLSFLFYSSFSPFPVSRNHCPWKRKKGEGIHFGFVLKLRLSI